VLLKKELGVVENSYDEASLTRPPAQPALSQQLRADVCVVGGGYAGLSAALELAERGYAVVLLEAQRLVYLGEYGDKVAPEVSSRIMQVGTYMIATGTLAAARAAALIPSRCAASDTNFILDYFRFTADHRLLFGGGDSYTGSTPRMADGEHTGFLDGPTGAPAGWRDDASKSTMGHPHA